MSEQVLLAKLTRREFREALERGEFQTAIIPVGSNEQHLEHLAMEHDTASSTHVAVEAAKRLYPQVIVNVPMAVGISEHHMVHKGTVTAKPGSWLAVLFDAVESLVRHGVKKCHCAKWSRRQCSSPKRHIWSMAVVFQDRPPRRKSAVDFLLGSHVKRCGRAKFENKTLPGTRTGI